MRELIERVEVLNEAAMEAIGDGTETEASPENDKKGLSLLSIMLISLGVMVALIVLIATIYILYVFLKRCSGNRVGVMPQRQ